MKKKTDTTSLVPQPSVAPDYRARVSDAYAYTQRATVEWFKTVVAFGALLDEVAAYLGEARGVNHKGEGLQTWLAENCPEVNYKTAMGYKAMAGKCAKMIGGGTQAIAALQGREVVSTPGGGKPVEIDAEILDKREALFAEADSRRKLEQMYLDFMSDVRRGKAGRPKGTKAKIVRPTFTPEEDARILWSKLIEPAQTYGLEPAASLLTADDAASALELLTGLCDVLKRRLATLKKK